MATRKKTRYVCNSCGYVSVKWLGKCPECNSWNSFSEEIEPVVSQGFDRRTGDRDPINILDIEMDNETRYTTSIPELDLVLGGGLVAGSMVLVGGDPGIGKSTLLLQVASQMGKNGKKTLYISGEESAKQIKLRSSRLDVTSENIFLSSENNMDFVLKFIDDVKPDILIIDSIQTMFCSEIMSAPGTVSQVREATMKIMNKVKTTGTCAFIVGHVTKSGSIAGPKVLEHMVDTVLYFEGDNNNIFRMIRSVKNRFGSTNEIGVFEMTGKGLKEIKNPSSIFISDLPKKSSGSVITPLMEGSRPILVEIQSLVSETNFTTPRRTTVGVDYNKTVMLLAVLEKKVGMPVNFSDCYVNVVGGISASEPSADLAIISAVASSQKNKIISEEYIIFGEVGLTGEVRSVSHCQNRINEALRLGFKKCVIPKKNLEGLDKNTKMEIFGVETVEEAFDLIFQ